MPKFFLPPEALSGETVSLTGEPFSHARVLRLQEGDAVTLCDGAGTDYLCRIREVRASELLLQVESKELSRAEPSVHCSVFLAYPKADKLEHVIQKAAELGASEIAVFPSARCVSRPDEKSLARKLERWEKIARSAAEQSRRGRIPTVRTLGSFSQALAEAARTDLPILFYENEAHRTFRSALEAAPFRTACLMTGPEGGFEPSEIRQAEEAGLRICTLGSRILRCETAPLCALSALMYAAGEF